MDGVEREDDQLQRPVLSRQPVLGGQVSKAAGVSGEQLALGVQRLAADSQYDLDRRSVHEPVPLHQEYVVVRQEVRR